MIDYKGLLVEFHRTLFRKTGDWRQDINQKFIAGNPTTDLRAALIHEESNELIQALLQEDIQQVRKELCDVLYVAFAIAAIYNLPVEEDFMEVHKNNLMKFDNGFVGPNGKWLKSVTHPKVTLKPLYQQLEFDI